MKPHVVLVTEDALVKIENDAPILRHLKLLPNERLIVITTEQPMAFTYARVLATPDDALRFSDVALIAQRDYWVYALQQKGTVVIELTYNTVVRYVHLDEQVVHYYHGSERTSLPLASSVQIRPHSTNWNFSKTVKHEGGDVHYFVKKKKNGVTVKSVSS